MSGIVPACSAPACDILGFVFPVYVTMLTVEDGSIVSIADGDAADADTYVDVGTVSTYATRYGFSFSSTTLLQEQAILRAMIYIEAFEERFAGSRVSDLQVLSWPRAYVPNPRETDYLSSTTIPAGIKNALAEAAIIELASPGLLTQTIDSDDRFVIKERKKVGPLEKEVQYSDSRSSTARPEYTRILEFLKPFFATGNTGRVYRA